MNYLSDIVNVAIELEQPVVNTTSFNNLLIVGPEPVVNKGIPEVGVYSNITELNELGIVTEGKNADYIGAAARVAFSQSPPPAKVYVAYQKRKRGIDDCKLILITEENYNEYLGEIEKPEGLPWLAVSYDVIGGEGYQLTNVKVDDEFEEVVRADSISYVSLADKTDSHNIETVVAASNGSTMWVCNSVFDNGELAVVDERYEHIGLDAEYEDITDTLNRALDVNGWYVICPAFGGSSGLDAVLPIMKQWVETKQKIMAYPVYEVPSVESKLFRSFGVWVKESATQSESKIPQDNHYMHVGWVARSLNYQAGSETWAIKSIVGMYPATLNSTFKATLDKYNISYYVTYSNRDITLGGKVDGGEWIDVIRFRDWLQNDMQVAVFELLVKNSKLPYTDGGIAQVKNAMIASLKRGQAMGGIAPTEFDANDDEIPGFVVNVPRASDIRDADKKQRILNDCTFRARLAGAIHAVNINGCLAYSM